MDNSPFFNVASPPHHPLPLRTHARTLNKIQTMKPRNQNKIFARSSKTTVVLFVLLLSLLFDKTESGEPGDSTDSTDSSDSSDSTDSMFSRKDATFGTAKPRKRGVLISRLSENQHQCNFQSNFQSILSAAPLHPQGKLIIK